MLEWYTELDPTYKVVHIKWRALAPWKLYTLEQKPQHLHNPIF